MAEQNINWFPGHMAKAGRMIEQNMKLVDAVCEIVDARIPASSRNPDLDRLCGTKPRMIILNRCDLADPAVTAQWRDYYKSIGQTVLETDSKSGKGVSGFPAAVRSLLREKIESDAAKGRMGALRCMVVGIPNVGKSTFINRVAGRRAAEASDRPGVTRGKQWITVDSGLELLDTPGILWPKIEKPETGTALAFTGAIKDQIMDTEALAAGLLSILRDNYPGRMEERYKITETAGLQGYELLEAAARKRGMLISRGEVDTERMAAAVLDEFRAGKFGKISFERP